MRITELRKGKNISQAELAEYLGVVRSAVCQWEKGNREPDNATLQRIADYFGVSVDCVLGRSEYQPANVTEVDGILVFEEIGTVRAGYNGTIDEITTGRTIDIPATMIHGGDKSDYFVLRVKGNSMYPRLVDGDTILCKRCNSVDSGTLAVVLYNGDDATVKKVSYINGQNWLDLIPINPEYETKRIEGADLDDCRILGKVSALIREF